MSKDCQPSLRRNGISVREVSRRLKEEWSRSKSLQKLKDIISTVVKEHDFNVSARVNILDIICWNYEEEAVLPVVASLVEAGARVQTCIIIPCIAFYVEDTQHYRGFSPSIPDVYDIDPNSVGDYLTILLKHGAELNDVQRTESGVKLISRCLEYLLSPHSPDGCPNQYRFQLIIFLLVHGACVTSVNADGLLEITGNLEGSFCTATSKEDGERLLRYLLSAGCRLYSLMLPDYLEDPRDELIQDFLPDLRTLKAMHDYTQSLLPRTQSLQSKCRRVVRQQMSIAADGKSILDGIDDLPLPPILLDYMKFKDAE